MTMKLLPQHLPGGTKEVRNTPQSGQSASMIPKYEAEVSA
jgi:hypothetical protein